MTIEAIGAISSAIESEILRGATPSAAPDGGMGAAFMRQIESVDASVKVSENDMRALATGNVQNLHEVMIRMEEAKLSFQLLAQVRNRMLEAYQEVMRTQV